MQETRKKELHMVIPTAENYYGREILAYNQLASPDFGTGEIDENGIPEVDWKGCRTKFADENGFDTRNVEENGLYKISYILPKGTIIIRFGSERGKYTAPQDTRFEEVALPYKIESVEYHEYRVIADGLPVHCIVEKGRVAPMFNQPGGGVQYLHSKSIHSLVWDNQLERIK